MSYLFCFGCNYPGEEHDERCPEYVDVSRLIEQRDRLRTERDALAARIAQLESTHVDGLHAGLIAQERDRLAERVTYLENLVLDTQFQACEAQMRVKELEMRERWIAVPSPDGGYVLPINEWSKAAGRVEGYAAAERDIVGWIRAESLRRAGDGRQIGTLEYLADDITAGAHRPKEKL